MGLPLAYCNRRLASHHDSPLVPYCFSQESGEVAYLRARVGILQTSHSMANAGVVYFSVVEFTI